ncbi:MAG: hypothetical protein J6C52_03740 [Clostridia bacterium]|nr:hypothetical protein [Clostridia bacterium]
MKTIRSTSLTLAALLAVGTALTACGGSAGTTDTTAASGDTTAPVTEALTGRDAVMSDLPADLDFGGETLTVLCREEEIFAREFLAEEENGDVINDAVYHRNVAVEDALNINLEVMTRLGNWGPHTEFMNSVKSEVFAGDSSYDVISFYAYCNPTLASEGVYMNLYELEHLNLAKPWWHQAFVESATVYDKLFSVSGDIILSYVSCRYGMYFNTVKLQEYLPGTDIYKMVDDNNWTLDNFGALIRDVYHDVNGDTQRDDGDIYGYFLPRDSALAVAAAGGFKNVEADGKGGFTWNFMSERNVRLFEKLFNLIKLEGVLYNNEENRLEIFEEGNCIFYSHRLEKTELLREMKDDYGLVPNPKLDKSQEKYYSLDADYGSQVSVPITAKNPTLVGAFLEKMGEMSYKMVTPVYLDTALKGKYLRDDSSARMVDLIIEGTWQDFVEINAGYIGRVVGNAFLKDLTAETLASNYESKKASVESKLAALLEIYKDA